MNERSGKERWGREGDGENERGWGENVGEEIKECQRRKQDDDLPIKNHNHKKWSSTGENGVY